MSNVFSRARRPYRKLASILIALSIVLPMLAIIPGRPAEAATGSTLAQYRAWMIQAKALYPYPQTIDKMYRVMICESSGNRLASGGGGRWLGLYQYAPGTWHGRWNPYRNSSIWDAKAQIFATAKAWSVGMQSHWSCYYITRGR